MNLNRGKGEGALHILRHSVTLTTLKKNFLFSASDLSQAWHWNLKSLRLPNKLKRWAKPTEAVGQASATDMERANPSSCAVFKLGTCDSRVARSLKPFFFCFSNRCRNLLMACSISS